MCLAGIRQETGNKPEICFSNVGKAGGLQQARENEGRKEGMLVEPGTIQKMKSMGCSPLKYGPPPTTNLRAYFHSVPDRPVFIFTAY